LRFPAKGVDYEGEATMHIDDLYFVDPGCGMPGIQAGIGLSDYTEVPRPLELLDSKDQAEFVVGLDPTLLARTA
jgi:hypothetical protein